MFLTMQTHHEEYIFFWDFFFCAFDDENTGQSFTLKAATHPLV